jgi:hypothetical protein
MVWSSRTPPLKAFRGSLTLLLVFFDHGWMVVNLNKFEVIIFNTFKNILLYFDYYFFKEGKVEISTTYSYFGVQFKGARFKLTNDSQTQLSKGYATCSVPKIHCFHLHIQDILMNMHLFETIIKPNVIYLIEVFEAYTDFI